MEQHGVAGAGPVNRHVLRTWLISDITGEPRPGTGRHVIGVQSRKMWLRYQAVLVSAADVECNKQPLKTGRKVFKLLLSTYVDTQRT